MAIPIQRKRVEAVQRAPAYAAVFTRSHGHAFDRGASTVLLGVLKA